MNTYLTEWMVPRYNLYYCFSCRWLPDCLVMKNQLVSELQLRCKIILPLFLILILEISQFNSVRQSLHPFLVPGHINYKPTLAHPGIGFIHYFLRTAHHLELHNPKSFLILSNMQCYPCTNAVLFVRTWSNESTENLFSKINILCSTFFPERFMWKYNRIRKAKSY